jgi:hypothetical protein
MNKRWALLILLTAGLLSGCTALAGSAQPAALIPQTATEPPAAAASPVTDTLAPTIQPSVTPTPDPTGSAAPIHSPTASPPPSATRRVTRTLTPTNTRRPTRTPTITPTPPIPDATIQIYDPGALSRVVSPLKVNLSLRPGKSVRLELLGEDGALLVRKIFNYQETSGARIYISEDLDFELAPGTSQLGRLVVSATDTYNRLLALNSVDLILLSVGENDLNPPATLLESIFIKEPLPKTLIQGGKVVVSGLVRPNSGGALLAELIAADGRVVGYRQGNVTPAGDHIPFVIEIPYSVDAPTWVRLSVKEISPRIPGITALSSIEILLGP